MTLASDETISGANLTTKSVALLSGTQATSPAAAGYAVSTAQTGFQKFQNLRIDATLTGATGGTLDVVVETSPDGTNWYEMVHFAQKAAASAATQHVCGLNRANGTITAIGKNLTTTTVLAAGSIADCQWFDRLRVRMIAGTSTLAGAAQSITVSGLLWNAIAAEPSAMT